MGEFKHIQHKLIQSCILTNFFLRGTMAIDIENPKKALVFYN